MNIDLLKRYKAGRWSRLKNFVHNPVKKLTTAVLSECFSNFMNMTKPEPDDFEAAWYVLKELNKREAKRKLLMIKLGGEV